MSFTLDTSEQRTDQTKAICQEDLFGTSGSGCVCMWPLPAEMGKKAEDSVRYLPRETLGRSTLPLGQEPYSCSSSWEFLSINPVQGPWKAPDSVPSLQENNRLGDSSTFLWFP